MILEADRQEALIAAVRSIASKEILPRFKGLTQEDITTKSRQDDLVTTADRKAEARISEAASEILPEVTVVGEEAVSEHPDLRDAMDADTCLIVDPVDGTWNFAHGIAVFGVILSLTHKGHTIWGMIYDPIGDDWILANRGGGAKFCRPQSGEDVELKIGAGHRKQPSEMMGYVHSYLFHGTERRRLFSRLPEFHKTDALRCSAHEYRILATGGVEFCLSPVLNPWDHAAGCLIAVEAGGVARLVSGEDYAPSMRRGHLLVAASEDQWQTVAHTICGEDGSI